MHFSPTIIYKPFKNKDFLKILKTGDDLNYLAKFVEHFLFKTHLDASESAKKTCDVTKVENFDKKNFLLYRKRTRKNHLNNYG
jgi:hypothetical protein